MACIIEFEIPSKKSAVLEQFIDENHIAKTVLSERVSISIPQVFLSSLVSFLRSNGINVRKVII